MKGTVFDIQRFALHDGPGIRSVAFLKGCPLHCRWCCNPESISPRPVLMYYRKLCIGCQTCTGHCPRGAVSVAEEGMRIDRTRCTACGQCAEHCPSGALRIAGQETDSEELAALLARDEPYFRNSGGGVTLSGGEPMMQIPFAIETLTRLHDRGIHTCMETSGFAPTGSYREAARVTDLFLVDYKLDDPARHVRYTGRDNAPVRETLQTLGRLEAEVILRAIIIPGVNDETHHFEALARIQHELPNITGIDVMVFHRYGSQKYTSLDLPVPDLYTKGTTDRMAGEWVAAIRKAGGKNVKRG